MTVYWVAPLAAVSFAGIVACGGGGNGKGAGANDQAPNPADTSAATMTVVSTNPDGVPYPRPPTGYGRNPRSGLQPGSIMQNFKYLGYPNGDSSQGLQPIAMADYYDPCGKRFSLIHLAVAAVWCPPCNDETAAMVQAKAQLDAQRVVVIQALDEGASQGTGATQGDLLRWTTKYVPKFSEVLDPELQNLGGFLSTSGVPWNCDIDPRTMEIIDESTGWALDVTSELQPAIDKLNVDANGNVAGPPGYPIAAAAACN